MKKILSLVLLFVGFSGYASTNGEFDLEQIYLAFDEDFKTYQLQLEGRFLDSRYHNAEEIVDVTDHVTATFSGSRDSSIYHFEIVDGKVFANGCIKFSENPEECPSVGTVEPDGERYKLIIGPEVAAVSATYEAIRSTVLEDFILAVISFGQAGIVDRDYLNVEFVFGS